MIKTAIKTSILSCTEVTTLLARHEFTSSTPVPAIFTTDPMPIISGRPCVQVVEMSSDLSTNRGENGMRVIVNVWLWGNKEDSSKFLSDLAVVLWRYLSNARFTISGYQFGGADVFYPVPSQDSDGFPGYGITIDVTFMTQGGW